MANVALRSFAGGELSPALYGRVDLARYQSALRQMRNFVAQRHGGAAMRPGTGYVAATKGNNTGRLIDFVVSEDLSDVYVLEIGDHYIRFYQDGVQLQTGAVMTWSSGTTFGVGNVVVYGGGHYYCKLTHVSDGTTTPGSGSAWQTYWYALEGTIMEIYSPYVLADLPLIQYVQVATSMTLVHPLYPPYELLRVSKGPPDQWSLLPIVFGAKFGSPTNFGITGGSAGAILYWAVTAVDALTGEEGQPGVGSGANRVPSDGTPTNISWTSVAEADSYNVYRSTNGITFGFVGVASGGQLSRNASNTVWTTNNSVVASNGGDWAAAGTQARQTVLTVVTDKATDSKYQIEGNLTITASSSGDNVFTTDGRVRAFYSRDGEPRIDAGIVGTIGQLLGEGTQGPLPFSGVITVPDNGYTALIIDLVPEVFGTGDGSLLDFTCTVDESVAPNNQIVWNKAGSNFQDTGTVADPTQAPPRDPGFFKSEKDYPSCVTQYQQRRFFANSLNNPGRVWGSRVAAPNNFLTATPLVDSAPVVFDEDGKKTPIVKHLLDLSRLISFNASQEKVIDGENQSGIIKPSTINIRAYSYNGAASLAPVVIDSMAVYLQARSSQVRMLTFNSPSGNESADLTIYADHLFRGRTIQDWAYAKVPDSILWAVRSDGTLLGLTLIQESDVWGWHRHDTMGSFESVCVVSEGTGDRVYVLVRRNINGQTVRYVERFALPAVKDVTDSRDFQYMDAAVLAYDGRNTDDTNTFLLTLLPIQFLVEEDGSTRIVTDDPAGPSDVYTEGSVIATLADIVAAEPTFSLADVGTYFLLVSPTTGERVYFIVTAFVSATEVQGYGEEAIPDSLVGVAFTDWARCRASVGGLGHLIGMAVSVLADGLVLSSPNNPEYPTLSIGGDASLRFDHPYSVIRVGLPFVGDLETLDIDLIPTTVKTRKRVVSRVVVYFENSGDVYVGQSDQPTPANLIQNLVMLKLRDGEAYTAPTALVTDDRDVVGLASHNTNGRVFIRQLDPLPTTVLMIAPSFLDE